MKIRNGARKVKIINLIENTDGKNGCISAHGLSFYIETEKHKLLLDLGPSEETIQNASSLGIDLSLVDIVVLSHGHYDHSGGIIPFTKINDKALIYLQKSAAEDYYADDGETATERYRYIGIDKEIGNLSQVRFIKGNLRIDDELELFTIHERKHKLPFTNKRLLVKKGNEYRNDDFDHEHFLVVHSSGKSVLLSGCAHNGVLSILEEYVDIMGKAPNLMVSGFHLMKKTDYNDDEVGEIKSLAESLKKYPTKFITCHCTGVPAYNIMKEIMSDSLEYVHSGEEISRELLV